jgi:hypothetical protein
VPLIAAPARAGPAGFLLAQIRDLRDIGGQGLGGLAMEQQVELAARPLQQLPAHGLDKGLEGSGVDGHGGEDCNGGMGQQALALGRCRNAAATLALPATHSAQSFPYPSKTTLKRPPNLPNPLAGAAPALACGLFL